MDLGSFVVVKDGQCQQYFSSSFHQRKWHGSEQYVVYGRCVMYVKQLSSTSTGFVANAALGSALTVIGSGKAVHAAVSKYCTLQFLCNLAMEVWHLEIEVVMSFCPVFSCLASFFTIVVFQPNLGG